MLQQRRLLQRPRPGTWERASGHTMQIQIWWFQRSPAGACRPACLRENLLARARQRVRELRHDAPGCLLHVEQQRSRVRARGVVLRLLALELPLVFYKALCLRGVHLCDRPTTTTTTRVSSTQHTRTRGSSDGPRNGSSLRSSSCGRARRSSYLRPTRERATRPSATPRMSARHATLAHASAHTRPHLTMCTGTPAGLRATARSCVAFCTGRHVKPTRVSAATARQRAR